jgi:hypothetical protein
MPGLRVRHDGWTAARTQRFLDVLGHTGCVTDAARVAGLSGTGARRMRQKFPAFAAAWDEALARAGQGLIAIAYKRAVEGRETIIIRNGKEYERRIAPSDSILGLLLKRSDPHSGRHGHNPDEILTLEEHERGIRFDTDGTKTQGETAAEARAMIRLKLDRLVSHTARRVAETNACWHCGQSLTPEARDKMLRHSPSLRWALDDVIASLDERKSAVFTPAEFDD